MHLSNCRYRDYFSRQQNCSDEREECESPSRTNIVDKIMNVREQMEKKSVGGFHEHVHRDYGVHEKST